MDQWIVVAERFGLPVIMLLGMSWGGVQLFKWLANDLMKQIAENHSRIEGIVIKLIDSNRKQTEATMKSAEKSNQQQEAIRNEIASLVDVMVKMSGNGLKRER